MGTGIRVTAQHMSFPVKDLARAREFYEGILGLEEIPRPAQFTFPGAWYQAGECEVHLIQTPEGLDLGDPPKALHPMARHSAFAVARSCSKKPSLRSVTKSKTRQSSTSVCFLWSSQRVLPGPPNGLGFS